MMMTITSQVGCGGGGSTDIERTLQFSELTDAEISRLVSAASGSEGFQAQAQVGQFDEPFDPDPCPLITIEGNSVTITGGCTTADGVEIQGSATVTNPPGWGELDYEYGSDSVYELSQLAFIQAGYASSYDGVFRIGSGYSELDMDLTTDSFGAVVRSDIYMDCSSTSCTISGSGVELTGIGGAHVSGKIFVGNGTGTGSIRLRGLDTVEVTLANNCVSWRLVGTERGFDPCQR